MVSLREGTTIEGIPMELPPWELTTATLRLHSSPSHAGCASVSCLYLAPSAQYLSSPGSQLASPHCHMWWIHRVDYCHFSDHLFLAITIWMFLVLGELVVHLSFVIHWFILFQCQLLGLWSALSSLRAKHAWDPSFFSVIWMMLAWPYF